MATTIEKQSEYTIHGRVVDRVSQSGVRGVRVEAWDRDTRYHDLLGQAVTNESGHFVIGFDSVYFGDYAPDRSPDLYFKVFLDAREVLSTFDRPLKNAARGGTEVKLELDLPQLQPEGRDRVSAQQTLKVVDWWRASDFRGAWREGADKVGTVGKLFGNLAGNSLGNFDFQPVRPKGTREREVVNQDVNNAQRALALQQVEVAEVRPVASGTRANLRTLKDYPLRLKPGDRVTLHEQDGVVKYYTKVPAADATAVDGQTVARIDGDVQSLKAQVRGIDAIRADMDGLKAADTAVEERVGKESGERRAQAEEIARLQRELTDVRKATAAKDVEIAKLRTDLTAVRTAQDNLATRLSADRLDALETQIKRLTVTRGTTPVGAPVPVAKKAVSKRIGKTAAKVAAKPAAKTASKAARKTTKKIADKKPPGKKAAVGRTRSKVTKRKE
ncbi:MAG TPA: hypothetical protein VGD42_03355 [Lysobacter sp.]